MAYKILSRSALWLATILQGSLHAIPPDFHAEVAPILRDYCAGCHNTKDQEGELNLETFASLKKGGESGSPLPEAPGGESLLQKVLRGAKRAMPPKKEPQPTPADLSVLEAWLKAGAQGPTAPDVSILSLVTVPDLPLRKKISPAITAAALSADSRWMALGRYQSVEILDPASKIGHRQIGGFEGKVTALAISPSGLIAAASGVPGVSGQIRVWDPSGKRAEFIIPEAHRDSIYVLRWSPDGNTLASGAYDCKIHLWDAREASQGKALRTLGGHTGAIFDLSFHPDGQLLASASADQTIKIWRVSDGERLDTLKEPQGEQFRVTFTPDGHHVVAAGADRRIRLWKLKSRLQAEINPMLEARFAHEAPITHLAVLDGGRRLLSLAQDRSAKIWSLPRLELDRILPAQLETVTALLPDHPNPWVTRLDGSWTQLELPPPHNPPSVNQIAAEAEHLGTTASPSASPTPEQEPNNAGAEAQNISLPAEIHGRIDSPEDLDTFRFTARAGQLLSFEVFAERDKSSLDSRIEILDLEGKRLERVLLQATRSSWLTFRGKDSMTSDDFRVQNYSEMELNEYLYCNGEVVKLWMYPRGPDSGFLVYPGTGRRQTFFGTSPLSHPLGQPVYTVQPLPPGSQPPPTGLPLFPVYWENDDDPLREAGQDSILHFTAPRTGDYLLRLTDTRGFGGEKFAYRLVARQSQPDFSINLPIGGKLKVSPGSGAEFQIKALRKDDFQGPIEVTLENLPDGFHSSGSLEVEPGQTFASGAVYAEPDAKAPSAEAISQVQWVGRARIGGIERVHRGQAFQELKLGAAPKLLAKVLPPSTEPTTGPVEILLHPGETVSARIRVERRDFKDRVEFGKEDSGRNLPHGIYVDNLGLNGLLVPEGETEREFFLTAAKWAPASTRWIFFRAKGDGGQATPPVLLRVVPK